MAEIEMPNPGPSVEDGVASWDGCSLACRIGKEITLVADDEDGGLLPDLPGDVGSLERVYWPLESLLVRTFSLPLTEVRLLDAAILSQELVELSGEDGDDWWLAWHAEKTDEGITGMVFGLPQRLRQAMARDAVWQQCSRLLVDGWERLNMLRGDRDNCAVLDEDEEGLFFGVFRHGCWRGMRRLNRQVSDSKLLSDAEMAEQIRYSWKAMGVDAGADMIVGRSGHSLSEALKASYDNWQVEVATELPSRHHANLAITNVFSTSLNFRHGKWAVRSHQHVFRRWRRPLVLAAGLVLIWVAATAANLLMLGNQASQYRSAIETAFHRGLPNEPVMLDPLAQLRQGSGISGSGQNGREFLKQFQALGQAYRNVPWQLKEFSYDGGAMQVSGSAEDIANLNRIRDQLQKASGHDVVITDTDLSDNKVSFRMKW